MLFYADRTKNLIMDDLQGCSAFKEKSNQNEGITSNLLAFIPKKFELFTYTRK